jgi:hypothetical protein
MGPGLNSACHFTNEFFNLLLTPIEDFWTRGQQGNGTFFI